MKDIKPLKKPVKIPLIQVFIGKSLTLSAAQALLSAAELMSEGAVETEARVYSGSTLFSIPLHRRFDFGKVDNLDALVVCAERSLPLHLGLLRLSRREAERRCSPFFIREMNAETAFSRNGTNLLIDVDVECPLAAVDEMEGEG